MRFEIGFRGKGFAAGLTGKREKHLMNAHHMTLERVLVDKFFIANFTSVQNLHIVRKMSFFVGH